VAASAAVALVFRALVGTYEVSSASMLPSLGPRDLVLGNKLAYGLRLPASAKVLGSRAPRRGDIIVLNHPGDHGPERLVKRVIGLPGDRIEMNGNGPIINGWSVPYCDAGRYLFSRFGTTLHARLVVEFLDDRAYLATYGLNPPDFTESYDVKENEVFVLGDNRTNSLDSRSWNEGKGGGVDFGSIEARASRHLATARGDERVSLSDILRPIGATFSLDGLDTRVLEQGIRSCLDKRPSITSPPRPGQHSARARVGGGSDGT
jgi:signal peptidase I